MKTKLTLLVFSSSLVLAMPALLAQNTNTNSLPLTQTLKYQVALENLFAAVNIERPLSMALLQQTLAETDVFSPGEEEGTYLYTPAEE